MRRRMLLSLFITSALGGCALGSPISTDLSARPLPSDRTEAALINVLAESMVVLSQASTPYPAATPIGTTYAVRNEEDKVLTFKTASKDGSDVKRYLSAGYALTDIYCDRFFRQTNQSMRRRKFGRALTNDVGTAINGVLTAITTVPKNVLGGLNAVSGGLDSTWRNYDDSFVVAPELQNVRLLVLAAQDQFRQKTKEVPPEDYMTARSAITRYAGLCSFLGMQALLNQSLSDQRAALLKDAAPSPTPTPGTTPTPGSTSTPEAGATQPPGAVAPAASGDAAPEPGARAGIIPPG